jgi:RNA polymerase sigma factor (sigma-70 family)
VNAIDHPLPPFQVFLDQHLEPVRAFLRGMVGPNDAEDCLQETFMAALRAYPRAHAQNLRSWVFTIAHHKAIDHYRVASRERPVADVERAVDRMNSAPPADAGLTVGARDSAIWAAVAELPPGQRAAVVLRFVADLRYREVGKALGTSEEAARRNVHEGLKKLRKSAAELKEMTT